MTPVLVTIDSSVFIASLVKSENNFSEANKIINKVIEGSVYVIIPWSVLVEVVSAIMRRTNSVELAEYIREFLLMLDNIEFIELNRYRSIQASKIGMQGKLRGMDSIIIQVAQEFKTKLITFDTEMKNYYDNLS